MVTIDGSSLVVRSLILLAELSWIVCFVKTEDMEMLVLKLTFSQILTS
jgi:hypothetical protein